jgi:WhiB family redox-sensing transcriptional regulator
MARRYIRADEATAHPFDDVPDLPCRDEPDEWFPKQGGSAVVAKQGCSRCPVQAACLAWALENEQSVGVWGGYAADARKTLHPAVRARLIGEGRALLADLAAARERNVHGRTTPATASNAGGYAVTVSAPNPAVDRG